MSDNQYTVPGIPEWIDAFSNRILGEATIDRLRHGAYTVILEGQGWWKHNFEIR